MNYFDKLDNRAARMREKYPTRPCKAARSMLAWSIKNLFPKADKSEFTDARPHIAVCILGGMGDLFSAARYVEGLSCYLGQKITVCLEKNSAMYAQPVFGGLSGVEAINAQNNTPCDVKIRLVRFPEIVFCDFKRLKAVGDNRINDYVQSLIDFRSCAPLAYNNDYFGYRYAQAKGKKREDQPDIDGILHLADVSLNIPTVNPQIDGPFITLQTGYGEHFKGVKAETRQWAVEKYERLIELLKQEYPHFKIVQIGVDYHPHITGTDLDLRGKTSIPEVFGLLKNAALHIQQEGGFAIARHYLCGKPSVVLFGPTDEKFLGFPENLNLRATGFECICEGLTKKWYQKCLKTGDCAACMQALSAQTVFEKIKESRILEDVK